MPYFFYQNDKRCCNVCHTLQYVAIALLVYTKPVKNGHSQKDRKLVFETSYCLMQVKSIAECSKVIKPPFVIKIFVLSIFEWPFNTGFTVNIIAI